MPKVQLIFILHVSTYGWFFRVVSAELCVSWNLQGSSWEQPGNQRRDKQGLASTELRACSPACAGLCLPRSGGSSAVLCRVRGCSGCRREHRGQRARLSSPSPSLLWHPRCLSLTIPDKRHSAGFLFLFLCSLWSFGFHASRESERGVCGYDLNLFACL